MLDRLFQEVYDQNKLVRILREVLFMSYSRVCRLLVGLICLAVYNLPAFSAEAKSDKVSFDTVDGVKIEGTYYPSNKGTKAPCALLLHEFDPKMGGSSRTQEWDDLAAKLQEKGYAVLSFDFRGFGQSTLVNPQTFYKSPQNMSVRGARSGKSAMTIAPKDFPSGYYRQLVNDVAAAKAYLDNENDAMQLNSRNLVVIGAGAGATVGLMWMDAECRRHRATVMQAFPQPIPQLDKDSAGDDLAGGVWLSLNPNLGGSTMARYVPQWLRNVGGVRGHKLPMAFLHGKNDPAEKMTLGYLRNLDPKFQRGKQIDKEIELSGEKAVDAPLTGSKLLGEEEAMKYIVKEYLENLMARRNPQWKARNNDGEYFYWKPSITGLPPLLAKIKGDKMMQPVPPPAALGLR